MGVPSGSAIHISISPHGSRTGGRTISTPRSRSSACAAATSSTWSHSRTDGDGAASERPDSSRNPPPRKYTVPRSGPVPNSRYTASPSRSPEQTRDRAGSEGRRRTRLPSTCTMRPSVVAALVSSWPSRAPTRRRRTEQPEKRPMESAATAPLTYRDATDADVDELVALIESAYRGDASRAGWTTEADLLDGQRTDPQGVLEVIKTPDSRLLTVERDGRIVAC